MRHLSFLLLGARPMAAMVPAAVVRRAASCRLTLSECRLLAAVPFMPLRARIYKPMGRSAALHR